MSEVVRRRHRGKTPDPNLKSPPPAKALTKAEGVLKKNKKNKGVTVKNCAKPLKRSLSFDETVKVHPIEAENPAPPKTKRSSKASPASMSVEDADEILRSIPVHPSGSMSLLQTCSPCIGGLFNDAFSA